VRSRALGIGLVTLAVVLAWLNGLFAHWWQTAFQISDKADRGDYLVAAGACLATALMLFVAMLGMLVLRAPFWLKVLTAVGVGTQLALSITSYRTAQGMDDNGVAGTFDHGFARAFELPGSWPLLVVAVVGVVVLGRRRGRRRS
jgi:uncharacterized membrane protein YhaH (DUF805 family)